MKSKLTLTVVIALVIVISANAQRMTFEYGSAAELKGITKIFIDAGAELEVRDNIAKLIRKDLPNLTIADKPEDAEISLVFVSDSSTYFAGMQSTTTPDYGTGGTQTSSTPTYRRVVVGDGLVVKPIGPNRARLLMKFGDARKTVFERRPSTNFARAFVKAYREANKEEKKKD